MAQGSNKKISKSTASSSRRPQALGPKRGQRVIAPKKTSLIKQNTLRKKISSGLTAKTERNLAPKAGHLEILAGGKKDKKKLAEKSQK